MRHIFQTNLEDIFMKHIWDSGILSGEVLRSKIKSYFFCMWRKFIVWISFLPTPWRNNPLDKNTNICRYESDRTCHRQWSYSLLSGVRSLDIGCLLIFFSAQSIGLKVCPRIRIDLRSQYFPDFCSMVLEKMLRRFVGGVSWNISTVRITVTCMEFQSTTFSQAFGGRSGCSLVSSLCATMPRLFGPCFCGARSGRSIGKWVQ